jgi:hypothetical protein
MGKRGPKPKGKVKIVWSEQFAYAIGLLVSDGNLSPDGRHIQLTSKDLGLIKLFLTSLDIDVHIGMKSSGSTVEKKYYVVQFSDTIFYKFLLEIGLMPNKSKIIGKIKMPQEYFFNFLLGSFDGDGCTYSYFDPRWKSSFMFYTTFVSASKEHISWLQKEIFTRLGIKGHITGNGTKTVLQLKYAKADSMKLLRKMYPCKQVPCLNRKRLKIETMLRTIGQRL